MTTLIVCTTLSETLLSYIFQELRQTAGDAIVIDFDDAIHAELKKHLISSIPIRVSANLDWEKRDGKFRELFMPGKFLNAKIPTTELEAWKMLSLDRFSFWFRPQAYEEYELVMALNWDRAIVPLDTHHPLPWTLARHSGREVTAIQCGPIRTREMYDILKSAMPFSQVIFSNPADGDFVGRVMGE